MGASLSRFQESFSQAMISGHEPEDPSVANLVAQPAFAVYRNTVMKGCVDALQANFPAVARLVGDEWFRAAAAEFAAGELPREPSLLAYGDAFPAFLAGFPPASELPYLADVARLDRLWTEAHAAADAPAIGREAFSCRDPGELETAVLQPHPAARWAWFGQAPIFSIWRRNREEGADEGELAWQGEGALLTRPGDAVQWTAIDGPACRFLDACSRSLALDDALAAALEADPEANVVRLVNALLDAGAFCRLGHPRPDSRRTSP
ncbi:MAG: DUF2063 domain-containing protein [Betaproteobacteria bacterium]|nr:DUF2063 domain-containing protein [Betaproteobacteria bacterium]PWB62308.1 MAG: DUF2063 domain-containing protein [Betaproteobacteria bacterium]